MTLEATLERIAVALETLATVFVVAAATGEVPPVRGSEEKKTRAKKAEIVVEKSPEPNVTTEDIYVKSIASGAVFVIYKGSELPDMTKYVASTKDEYDAYTAASLAAEKKRQEGESTGKAVTPDVKAAETTLTIDEVRAKILALRDIAIKALKDEQKGKDEAKKVLAAVGATEIKAIKPADFTKAVSLAENGIAKMEAMLKGGDEL